MELSLDRDVEQIVREEVSKGHFRNAEDLLRTALRHFLVAQQVGEFEANKLASLREELWRADAEIDAGKAEELDERALQSLFDDAKKIAQNRLKNES